MTAKIQVLEGLHAVKFLCFDFTFLYVTNMLCGLCITCTVVLVSAVNVFIYSEVQTSGM